jgi:hypothetical protein
MINELSASSPVPGANLLRSAEVRWFLSKPIGQELFKRHAELSGAKTESTRVDSYLCFPGASFIGIKLREYKEENKEPRVNFECKLLERDCGLRRFPNGSEGRVELWCKWSTTIQTKVSEYKSRITGSCSVWQEVAKTRTIQKFEVTQGKVRPASGRVTQGCNFELTSLGSGGSLGETLGFEAFSETPNQDLQQILIQTVEHVLSIIQVPELVAKASFGYPQWLTTVRGLPN